MLICDILLASAGYLCNMLRKPSKTEFGAFRKLGLIEGLSFLVILGITMPLKYVFDQPTPNKYAGMIHGALFIFYCAGALQFYWQRNWPFWKLLVLWAAAVVPLGTFIADWKLLEPEDVGEAAGAM